MVGEVRHAARDPRATRNHVADKYDLRRDIRFSTRVEPATLGRRAPGAGTSRTESRRRDHLPLLRDGHRLPVAAESRSTSRAPTASAARSTTRSRWPHEGVDFTGKRVAVIGTRLVGHPVDPDHRRAGGAADRVPAHAELLAAGPQRPGTAGKARRLQGRSRRLPRGRAPVAGRRPGARSRWSAPCRCPRRSAAPRTRRRGTRATCSPTTLRRHADQRGGQRDLLRVPPRQDPLDRERSRRPPRRCARQDHYYGTKRPCLDTGLLRDLQPAARPAGRPAQDADRAPSPRRASDHRASRSSSTPSCSPPASTR